MVKLASAVTLMERKPVELSMVALMILRDWRLGVVVLKPANSATELSGAAGFIQLGRPYL